LIGGALIALGLLFGKLLALLCLVLGQAAFFVFLAAAARAGIIASGLVHRGRRLCRGGFEPCTCPCCPTPVFTIFCSPSIGILPMRRAVRAARGAAACCIPPSIGASPAAVPCRPRA